MDVLLVYIYVFAGVHFYLYRDLFLLMCKGKVIEKILCFCAAVFLLTLSVAYMQANSCWVFLLLGCNTAIIEHLFC